MKAGMRANKCGLRLQPATAFGLYLLQLVKGRKRSVCQWLIGEMPETLDEVSCILWLPIRHAHGEPYLIALVMLFKRYRQRYGGYMVHLGLVLLVVGVIGSHYFQLQGDALLNQGQNTQLAGYQLVYLGNIDTKKT